jgi:cell division protein ZapA (FtsZ GTPase activity inhibitor)
MASSQFPSFSDSPEQARTGASAQQRILTHESAYWSRGAVKNTEISVGGVKVKVRTDATPNHLKLVRELVDSRYENFSDRLNKGYSTEQLTVLVAFNLAEELLKERARTKFFKKTVVECTERLLSRVESFLDRRSLVKSRESKNKTR